MSSHLKKSRNEESTQVDTFGSRGSTGSEIFFLSGLLYSPVPLEQNGSLPHPLMSKLLTYKLLSALIEAARIEQWVQLTARLVNWRAGCYRQDFYVWRLTRRILASAQRHHRICEVYSWVWYTDLDEPLSALVLYEVERALPFVDVRQHCHVYFRQTSE